MTKTIAYVLYPGLTALDLVGPLTVTATLGSSFETVVVAEDLTTVATDAPVHLAATATFDQLTNPYALVVPGGVEGTFAACANERLLRWIRDASVSAEVTASVCTGSLILGAAGLLEGRHATTHWAFRDLLTTFGATPVAQRWVEDGDILTAAGVSAGIDMALHLVDKIAGEDAARMAQVVLEYDPEPPFGSIDWTTVDTTSFQAYVTDAMQSVRRASPDSRL